MKRLLLPLLAALALPTAINAEVKLKPTVSNFSYVLYKHLELGFHLGYSIDRTTLLYKEDDADLYECIGNAKNNWEKGKLFSNGLENCPSYFSLQMVKMMRDGETLKNEKLLTDVLRDFSDGVADGKFNKDDCCDR
tara:strand:+ start:238 stop:645 length:408 start_codon:yes stop_codon:yes gene_type:complete